MWQPRKQNHFLVFHFRPVSHRRDIRFRRLFYTSMFVERMEVLKYRQKFEVELITLPTLKRQENWFLASCVCVCVSVYLCEKVCQWISGEQVDRFEWKFRCMLQLASNRGPPLVVSTIGPIFPHNMGRELFLAILWTVISRKLLKISKSK